MSRIKNYYHVQICDNIEERSRIKDADYQYQQFLEKVRIKLLNLPFLISSLLYN